MLGVITSKLNKKLTTKKGRFVKAELSGKRKPARSAKPDGDQNKSLIDQSREVLKRERRRLLRLGLRSPEIVSGDRLKVPEGPPPIAHRFSGG